MALDGQAGQPDLLFHYTDAVGFLGVLQEAEMWLTDIEFVNDAQEIEYARPHAVDGILGAATTLEAGDVAIPEDVRLLLARRLREVCDALAAPPDERPARVFVMSFCEQPDLLSQWRGYAAGGGYAMGWSTADLRSLGQNHTTGLVRVRYGLGASMAVAEAMAEVVGDLAIATDTPSTASVAKDLMPLLAAIKHPAFKEEHEWRLVLSDESATCDFRAGGFGLLPFRRVGVPLTALREVYVGPGPHVDLRIAGVRHALRQYGATNAVVRPSVAPFRG